MENAEKRIPGKILEDFVHEIENLELLIEHLDEEAKYKVASHEYRTVPSGGESESLWSSFREQTTARLMQARADLFAHKAKFPTPEKMVCPHCGYDGEFGVEKPTGQGFRLLEPVLQPRRISSYDGSRIGITDTVDSYDPFDMISDPGYHEFLDEKADGLEAELRKDLRGRLIICCGDNDCLGYFDGRPFVTNGYTDYTGEHGSEENWGMPKPVTPAPDAEPDDEDEDDDDVEDDESIHQGSEAVRISHDD